MQWVTTTKDKVQHLKCQREKNMKLLTFLPKSLSIKTCKTRIWKNITVFKTKIKVIVNMMMINQGTNHGNKCKNDLRLPKVRKKTRVKWMQLMMILQIEASIGSKLEGKRMVIINNLIISKYYKNWNFHYQI